MRPGLKPEQTRDYVGVLAFNKNALWRRARPRSARGRDRKRGDVLDFMQRNLAKRAIIAVFLLISAFSVDVSGQRPESPAQHAADTAPVAPRILRSFDASFIDTTVDPCNDFYKYACGNWVKANPVPVDDERVWITGQMDDRNFYLLYTELKQAAASPTTPLEKQYGTFYQACMNTDQADRLGEKPLQPTLAAINGLTDKAQIAQFLGDRRYLGTGFFSLTVEQDEKNSQKQLATLRQAGLTLPTPEYYLKNEPHQVATLATYRHYLEIIFRLSGDRPSDAATEAKDVLQVETALASGSMSRTEMRDPARIYHPMTLATLKQLSPDFYWQAYFKGRRMPSFTRINVEQPIYFQTMARVISAESLPALKSYLRLHAIDSVAPYLSSQFEQASFQFFNTTLRGQAVEQPRWKRCTVLSDKVLGDAVGQEWVRRNFSPESKAGAEEIIANVRSALREEIENLSWMSASAKQEAEHKVDAMREKIGYPSHWRDYSSLKMIPTDFVADLHSAELLNQQDELSRIGKPVDEGMFYWTAPEADGNYNEHLNDIEFPAGILQPPRYSPSADAAVNYGGLGTFVGHEMTHGFDDVGSRYDEQGNLRDWFTPADRVAFNRMTSCEINEYSRFEAAPGLRLDGELSLGENTADNGGLRIAYRALEKVLAKEPLAERDRKLDGYTPDQQFFLGFAQTWCENRTDEFQRVRGQTDPHPPGEFRVNGTVQNSEPFGKAFGCHIGQPMMPANACPIW